MTEKNKLSSQQDSFSTAGANRELIKSEERYHKMVDEVIDYAIIFLDTNGIIQNWNKGAENIKQYKEAEAVGQHFSMFYLPEDRANGLPEKLLTEAVTKGRAIHDGWRLRKDGNRFWGSITLTALHGEQGEVIGFSKVTRDLTEKKTVEDQLRQYSDQLQRTNDALRISEERYHKMVDEVQDYAIIFLDKEGIIQNWNKGAQKIKQYQESEVVGEHFRMFYLPEDRLGRLPEILLQQAREHGRAIHEGWRMRKDRTKFWGSVTLTALHNDQKQLIGFSKLTRDLTERKMAEDQLRNFATELQLSNEELQKSEERYHKMISEVQEYAIILMDINGNIQNWNAGAEKIKGYSAEEIIGKNFQIFYTPEARQKNLPQRLLEEATINGKAVQEGWRVTKSGSRFWGSIVITALHSDDGSLIGFSKVTRNLTDKKKAEDKLKDYLFELEKQNEELDAFAYAASHDLQEPLRKIVTFVDLIEQNINHEETVKKYTEKIAASARRMSELIKSVLEFSHLSKDVHHKIPTDLNRILLDVLGDFELLVQQKDATIKYDQLPVIQAIPLQINQLFSNLIGNALKFTDQHPMIHISSNIVEKEQVKQQPSNLTDRKYLQLVFTDNGIGFDPQYGQMIFSLFQCLHSKQEYSGTGIGLALCKKVMDNHRGWIAAESNPGKGTSFYVYFPVD